jgi:hypothetical protein
MSEANYIEKTQLPIELDYKSLQEKSLAYIQDHSTTAWSNLNPSDPGITILEQLCYAFTELGYCNDFPIQDILTNRDNKLQVKNQFYLPKDILTIAPITVQDYNKYLIDRVQGLKNVVTNPLKTALFQVKGAYRSYILLDNYTLSKESKDAICTAAFYELNNVRNFGEYFLTPTYLVQDVFDVDGDLEIKSGYILSDVLKNIQYQINNYVFPDATQTGYDNLKHKGLSTNEIFNGPILKNGWIPDYSIKSKKDTIKNFEITQVIESVPGVRSMTNLSFCSKEVGKKNEIKSKQGHVIFLSILRPVKDQLINVIHNGKLKKIDINLQYIEDLIQMQLPKNQADSVAAVKMIPDVPKGDFRDVESYYSIQNTFPQSYGLGMNDQKSNASEFQIAQSRQLKGYLTLYDQVLINQFSQLANLEKLFSFKNSITGTPFDTNKFYDKQTQSEKTHQEFPAPFQSFSPTYFYESLYTSSPDIEKLLKNHNTYRYSPGLKTPKELDNLNWIKYKGSPYNSYIWGLMQYMEDEELNLERRNDILNHLLARHGESPLLIDTIINNPVYSGNLEKDRVIIKSLYLQNLQTLSYYKNKAYNYLGANELKTDLEDIYQLLLYKLQELNVYNDTYKLLEPIITKDLEAAANILLDEYTHASQSDFIFDVDRIDEREKVTSIDIINYSTLELKLSLLFGLNEYYKNNIVDYSQYQSTEKDSEGKGIYQIKRDLLWMITRRKGLLLIETNLLINHASFQLDDGDSYLINKPKCPDNFNYEDLLDSFQNLGKESKRCNINAQWYDNSKRSLNSAILKHTIILVFPVFLETDEFKTRLDFFLRSELPPQITYKYLFISENDLKTIIPIYSGWHNSLIHKSQDSGNVIEEIVFNARRETSWNLLFELEKIDKNQKKL